MRDVQRWMNAAMIEMITYGRGMLKILKDGRSGDGRDSETEPVKTRRFWTIRRRRNRNLPKEKKVTIFLARRDETGGRVTAESAVIYCIRPHFGNKSRMYFGGLLRHGFG